MFIPRTLAQTEGPGPRAWARAAIVGILLSGAIFVVLSANVTTGQVNLTVGDVAQADIRAPRTCLVKFVLAHA